MQKEFNLLVGVIYNINHARVYRTKRAFLKTNEIGDLEFREWSAFK